MRPLHPISHVAIALAVASIALLCARVGYAASESPRVFAEGTIEMHGTWKGERFWARLLPGEERFGGKRILQLLYGQPSREALAGTVLVDHPFVLVDDHLRIWAWNERRLGLSSAEYRGGGEEPAYRIVLGYLHGEGEDAVERTRSKKIPADPAWDRRLAPLLATLAAPSDGAAVPSVDLFHQEDDVVGAIRLAGDELVIGEDRFAIERDDEGRVVRILDGEDPILEVREWLASGENDAGPGPEATP